MKHTQRSTFFSPPVRSDMASFLSLTMKTTFAACFVAFLTDSATRFARRMTVRSA